MVIYQRPEGLQGVGVSRGSGLAAAVGGFSVMDREAAKGRKTRIAPPAAWR
jgi:hypothetical protein